MKIAYFINGTFNSGGMERTLSNKTNYLANVGYDVTIITTDQMGRDSFFKFDNRIRMIDLGVNFAKTNGSNIFIKIFYYFKKQRLFKQRISELFSKEKFDIVISMFGPEVHWLPQIKDGSHKIAEIHFSKFFRLQQARKGLWAISDKYRSMQDQKAMKRYDKFVVLTNEDKSFWGDLPNIEVIHNVCHIKALIKAKLENHQAIAVGRLTYQKGYNYMVDAWKIVSDKHPNWVLNIFGSGEDKLAIENYINQLSMTGKIKINSPTLHIEKEILQSSMLLFSSRYEGFGLVLTEAMACGVPCVSFACKCGPRDIIDDGVDGFLVEDNNIEQMADRICALIENEELRRQMGQRAVEKVTQKFSQEVVMQQWISLLKSIVNK